MTKIEWTDEVWNVVTGCTKVSPGCDNCYAETFSERFRGTAGHHFENGFDLTLRPERLALPLKWRKARRVFVNSMSDLFHKDIPDDYVARTFAIMALTPQHKYQILTKRHGRMRSLIGGPCSCGHPPGEHLKSKMAWAVSLANPDRIPGLPDDAEHRVYHETEWPLPNVWLGVSVEDQKRAELRIPALLETPAAVRFLSCEPLLGLVDLTQWHGLDWVIVGGESGHRARAMHPRWAQQVRDDCEIAGVPFFFKQWGEWGPAPFIVRVCDPNVGWTGTEEELAAAKADSEARGATHVHTGHWLEKDGERTYWLHEIGHKPWSLERVGLPDGTAAIRRWGKAAAGRELDGRTWDEMPREVQHA